MSELIAISGPWPIKRWMGEGTMASTMLILTADNPVLQDLPFDQYVTLWIGERVCIMLCCKIWVNMKEGEGETQCRHIPLSC